MDILYLLIPLSAVMVLAIIGVFYWALQTGQFDDLEQHGVLGLADMAAAGAALDPDQAPQRWPQEESVRH